MEKVHFYIHDKILVRIAPSFLHKEAKRNVWNIDEDDKVQMISIKFMLEHCKLSSLSQSTVWSWMQALRMRFGERKKNYYVDGHEQPDVVLTRLVFVKTYLVRDLRMHRWIQVSPDDLVILDTVIDGGYKYIHDNGDTMYEFHIDAHQKFADKMKATEFGANLTVRKPKDSKILIGWAMMKPFTAKIRLW